MEYNEEFFREETINVKEIIHKVWRHWEYFAIACVISLLIAFFYNKIKIPLYESSTTILINEEKSAFDPQALLGLDYTSNRNRLLNEIEILKSESLLEEVFKITDFNVRYFQVNKFNSTELHKSNPFIVSIDSAKNMGYNYAIGLKIHSHDSIEVFFEEGLVTVQSTNEILPRHKYINNKSIIINSGDTIKTELFCFTVSLNNRFDSLIHCSKLYQFSFPDLKSKINEFRNIDITSIDQSSVIKISIQHQNLLKSIDFLNALTQVFLKKELIRKNQVAQKSLNFIESHLAEINDSLNISEQSLLDYQTDKGALNIDYQTQNMFEQLEKLQSNKAEILIQQKYYDYLKQTLYEIETLTDIIAPSVMNVNNQILNNQINNLITIQSELNNIKFNPEKQNPYITSLTSRIENAKNVLLEYIKNDENNLKISLKDINSRIDDNISKINLLPKTQRELFNYERDFKVYDNIYTFLLQKRSETMLTLASNVPLNEIVDYAKVSNYKVISKNKRLSYIIALIIGVLIPALFIYLKEFFNNKILTDSDIEKLTELPILGRIINSKSSEMAFSEPKSLISESFRMLRTNLDFAKKETGSQVILITSTFQGEGKSFVSNNLAHSLALNNRKTILLVFDLRKPKIYLGHKTGKHGLSTYLINKAELNEIIRPSEIENLDIISTGVIPPNPSELISSPRTQELIKELKEMYDYVIIDSPPIGIISDGLALSKMSDIVLFVIRYNYSRIKPVSNLLKSVNGNIQNMNIVTNSLEIGKKAYGYEYGYGYGKYGDYNY